MAERVKGRASGSGQKRKADASDATAASSPPPKKRGRPSKSDKAAAIASEAASSSAAEAKTGKKARADSATANAKTGPSKAPDLAPGESRVKGGNTSAKSKGATKAVEKGGAKTNDKDSAKATDKGVGSSKSKAAAKATDAPNPAAAEDTAKLEAKKRKAKLLRDKLRRQAKKAEEKARAKGQKEEPEEEVPEEQNGVFDDTLYCTCKTLYDPDQAMLACDICNEWYHTRCSNLKDKWINIVDQFICLPCSARTGIKTSWKPQCLNEKCSYPALYPLSKFCSERCGLVMSIRALSKFRTNSSKHRRLGPNPLERVYTEQVKEAIKREGCSTWAEDINASGYKDPDKAIELGLWDELTLRAEQVPNHELEAARYGISANADFARNVKDVLDLSHASGIYDEDCARWRLELDEIQTHRHKVGAAMDLLDARQTLCDLAIARKEELPILTEDGGDGDTSTKAGGASGAADQGHDGAEESPKKKKKKKAKKEKACGFDERLGWDDEMLAAYMRTEEWSRIRDDPTQLNGRVVADWCANVRRDSAAATDPCFDPTGATVQAGSLEAAVAARVPKVCGLPGRTCKRHIAWAQFTEEANAKERERLLGLENIHSQRETDIQRKLHAAETRCEKANAEAAARIAKQGIYDRLGLK